MKRIAFSALQMHIVARCAVIGMLVLGTGFGFLPTTHARAGGFTCPRPKSSLTIQSVLLNGQVLVQAIGGNRVQLVFSLQSPNDYSAAPPCPSAPDETFIHLASCTNINSPMEGAPEEMVCGSGIAPFATDVVTYNNANQPASINFAVRFEQGVCTGVPVGNFPPTTNPVFRKGTILSPPIVSLGLNGSLVTAVDDPGNDG